MYNTNTAIPKKVDPPQSIRDSIKPVTGAAIGNLVEWFDYSIYGYLAVTFTQTFFPNEDPWLSLIATFAAFAVAFIARPFGGLFFGSLGDRFGRRDVLIWVISLISISTFLVGVLPGYAAIGIAAPILLVLLRLIQGFSAGGEAGGALAFLAEYAPTKSRGFVINLFTISGFLGAVFASYLVLGITSYFGAQIMEEWAWRIPFLTAGPIGLLALWFRLKIEETPAFRSEIASDAVVKSPITEVLRSQMRTVLKCSGIAATYGVPYYLILLYLPSYLKTSRGFDSSSVITVTGLSFLVATLIIPPAALLSDRIGRKPLAIISIIVYILFSVIGFRTISSGSINEVYAAMILLSLVHGVYSCASFSMITELFPTNIRYTGLSIGYNLAGIVFFGTTPIISSWLVYYFGNPVSPSYYLIVCALISLICVLKSKEGARIPIEQLGK